MHIQRSLVFVVATTFGFGVAGGVIGAIVGLLAPAYYRSVFCSGQNPDFEPLQVGTGLGVTQGLVIGVVVALALLLASAIGRRGETSGRPGASTPIWFTVCVIAVALCSSAAFLIGGIAGQRELYHWDMSQKVGVIERVLETNGLVNVEIYTGSGGIVSLGGSVPDEGVKLSLQEALAVEFGVKEAEELTYTIGVSD